MSSSQKICFCQMTQDRLSETALCVQKYLPYVDRIIIVDGGSVDDSIPFFRNWSNIEPKLEFYIHPWTDNFSQQRNEYLRRVEDNTWCYDSQTEILTTNGFKYFEALDRDDQVATYNLDTKEISYHNYINKIAKQYIGKMFLMENDCVNFCVTPNHRMVAVPHNNKNYPFYFLTIDELMQYVSATIPVNGNHLGGVIPQTELVPKISNVILMQLLGWYIAEGWSYSQGFRHKIQISQTKEPYRSEIIALIKSIDRSPIFEPEPHADIITFYHKPLFDFLQQFGKLAWNKHLTPEIKQLDQSLLEILFSCYMKGDGSADNRTFSTTSPELASDLQEICFKLGKRCVVTKEDVTGRLGGINKKGQQIIARRPRYVGSITSYKETAFQIKDIRKIDYNGQVYCVEVPNGAIVVRRGGRVIVSGNCIISDPDEVFEEVTLQKLQTAIQTAEDKGADMVGFQCRSVSYKGPQRVWENLDQYHKRLLFKKYHDTRYDGNPHEHLVNHPHKIMDTNLIYEHVKQQDIIWQRGARNMWTGGGGPNGRHNHIHEWQELRNISNSLGLDTWHKFYQYLVRGNIDQRLKDWMISHRLDNWGDGSSEFRETYKTYFLLLHPEEMPQEFKGEQLP